VDIHIADYDALGPAEQDAADRHFRETVLPLVMPIFCDGTIVDAPNLGLNVVADLRQGGRSRLAIVRVPDQLPALVELPSGRFVWLDQVVFANLQSVFPDAIVEAAHLFRILRDADIVVGMDGAAADPSELPSRTIEAVRQRHTNPILMLVVERAADAGIVARL